MFATLGRTVLAAGKSYWDAELISEALQLLSHPMLCTAAASENEAVGPAALAEKLPRGSFLQKTCASIQTVWGWGGTKKIPLSQCEKNSRIVLAAAKISFILKKEEIQQYCRVCITHVDIFAGWSSNFHFIVLFYIMTTKRSSHRWSQQRLIHVAFIMTLTQPRDIMQINLSALTCWWTLRSRLSGIVCVRACVCIWAVACVHWITNFAFPLIL